MENKTDPRIVELQDKIKILEAESGFTLTPCLRSNNQAIWCEIGFTPIPKQEDIKEAEVVEATPINA